MSPSEPVNSLVSHRHLHLRISILLAILVLAAYANTFRYGFVFDDHEQIERSRFFTDAGWLPEYFKHPTALNYYRPLFLCWLLFNNLLFGPNPHAFHVTSVAVHLAATLLCYVVALLLTRRMSIAAIAALIFAVHPVHVESVAWISGVTDPLLALFVLGSFLAYLRGREGRRVVWWMLSALLAFGAMLAKETGVVVPMLIGAHALLFDEGGARARLRSAVTAALPALTVIPFYLLVRGRVLAGVGHNLSGSNATMVLTWPKVLLFYFWHLVWPTRLSVYYDLHFASTAKDFLLPLVVLVAVAGTVWRMTRVRDLRLILFGIFWILITLAPAFYLRAFNLNDLVHDRYLYLAVFGFGLVVAELLLRLPDLGSELVGVKTTSALASFLVVALFMSSTVAEQIHYANDIRLFYRAVHISPNSDSAWVNLGMYLAQAGRREDAYLAYRHAIEASEGNWLAHADLGFLLMESGRFAPAAQEIERALSINPRFATGLHRLALIRVSEGKKDEALQLITRAIELEPSKAEFHYLKAFIFSELGDAVREQQELEETLRLDPNYPGARQRYQSRFESK